MARFIRRPMWESVVLRLLESYMARGTMVKKYTWSCSLGWC
jgi:hypothetical protein